MKTETNPHRKHYVQALNRAVEMMERFEDLEPTSALKQAASDCGIPFGEPMKAFVTWANALLFSEVQS